MSEGLKKLSTKTIISIVIGFSALLFLIINLILGLCGVYELVAALITCIAMLFVISVAFLVNFNPKRETSMFIYNAVVAVIILGIMIAAIIICY